jgi:dihydrofolate reductase
MEEALELFKNSSEEVFNIGGGELYKQGLPFADKLYITHIDGEFDADVFFPAIGAEWEKVSLERHEKDSGNEYAFTFTEYKKSAD